MYRFFFFNDTPTTEIYTLSLHDALPISNYEVARFKAGPRLFLQFLDCPWENLRCSGLDRKSTRLNSSHANISYAVFCLKKKICQGTQSRAMIDVNTNQ